MRVLALRQGAVGASEEFGDRTGVFTSSIVSTGEGRQIALFFTGRKHAGENLGEVLKWRAAERDPPIQMCDALSRNLPKLPEKLEIIVGHCLAHARRRFVEVTSNFPEECRFVLESLGEVYGNDARAQEQGLSPEERLRFHQSQSGPVMDGLHAWLKVQFEERRVEPNSGLGEAISYLLKHWERLTLFLRQPGAPLDNNIAERGLKKAILHRNYVHQPITRRTASERSGDREIPDAALRATAHNHRVSRKAKRRSRGLNFRRLVTGIMILSIARFFIAKSASTYMCVVAVLSWPSQSAITVISTPD